MRYTANYNLAKPEAEDIINPNSRSGYNDNFDTLDTTLKSVSDKADANEGDITDLQGDIADINAKTGADIPFESGSADSISDKITNLDNSVGNKPSGETDTLWDKIGILYQSPKNYWCTGNLYNSQDTNILGYGSANVICYPNGLAIIHYNVKIEPSTNSTSVKHGLNRDLLSQHCRTHDLPQITPIFGGTLMMYNASGVINILRTGYGGTHQHLYESFWLPSRIYTTEGSDGGWGADLFNDGAYFVGTCYGTFTP